MTLRLVAPGANEVQRQRGEAAAASFLARAGITPQEAKRGADARTTWGDSGMSPLMEPTPEEEAAADAWDNARESALMACYGGISVPLGADLHLVDE